MSSYGGYPLYGGSRGGGSPYASHVSEPYTRNLSSQFEYIDADHDMLQDPPRASVPRVYHDSASTRRDNFEDEEGPDVIQVRYMSKTLRVHFPAYSISEGTALVGQLRDMVARALDTDPRRVRLVYKKRDVKHDSWPLRQYSMKQNSEVAAVITESVFDHSDRDSHSSDGEESSSAAHQNPRRRPRALSSVRHRSEENIPQQRSPTRSSYLSPNGHVPSGATSERQSRGSLRPELDGNAYRREPSRTRGTSPRPTPSSTPAPSSVPLADPKTNMGKLQALSQTLEERWLPLSRKFVTNPPSDPQDRLKEHTKLSEGLMQQIFLKADAIEVENNAERTARKELINRANDMVKQLDAALKSR